MEYALAVIGVTLVLLALIGKPIRIEIIHTVTQPPIPPEVVEKQQQEIKAAAEAMDALKYMNETFHHVEVGDNNGAERK